jgi:hypothetical protein
MLTNKQIKEHFEANNIEVIDDLPGPVFQIGLINENNDFPPYYELFSDIGKYTEVKTVQVKTISLDPGRFNFYDNKLICVDRTEDELITDWIYGVIEQIEYPGQIFILAYPSIKRLPIYTLDGMKYEEACMSKGFTEKVFSLEDITEQEVTVVYGRVYYEGMK